MAKTYERIPREGTHRGNPDGLKSGMNVRAPGPPEISPDRNEPHGAPAYQLLRDVEKGRYRLRPWNESGPTEAEADFEEVGRYEAGADWQIISEQLPEERYFVVLENTATGEVYFDRQQNLTSGWTDEGRFDQFTIFRDEAAAEAYADRSNRRPRGD